MIVINMACVIAVICSFLLIVVGLNPKTSTDRFLWYVIMGVVLFAMVIMTQLKVGGWS